MSDKDVARAFAEFEKAVASALVESLDDAALRIQAQAQSAVSPSRAPPQILVESTENPLERRVSVADRAARFLEFGTRRVPARPILTPALARETPHFLDQTIRILTQALDNLGGKMP